MNKSKLIEFILLYVVSVTIFWSIAYATVEEYDKQIAKIDLQIEGGTYIEGLYRLTISILHHLEDIQEHEDSATIEKSKKEILTSVDKIVKLQGKYPDFKSTALSKNIAKLDKSNISIEEYSKIVDYINSENYIIGNKSTLHFENDRELYFLGTLLTHYMPEYLFSMMTTHRLIEKFYNNKKLSPEETNLFIEQNKLLNLSFEEISSIVRLLGENRDSVKLQEYLKQSLELLKKCSLESFFYDEQKLKSYLVCSYRLLDLSYKLNDENFQLIYKKLEENRESFIERKEWTEKIFLLFLFIFSLIMFFYRKSHLENLKKDRELKNTNETLDKLVLYFKTDLNGTITQVSRAFEKLTGYTKEELLGSSTHMLSSGKMDKEFYAKLWDTLLSQKVYVGSVIDRAKDGREFHLDVTINPEYDERGKFIGFIAYLLDITDKIALEIEKAKTQKSRDELLVANKILKDLSMHDKLTQVYNRHKLDKIMKRSYESYQRSKIPFSVIILDIDFFKKVNDTYGHLVGDKVLQSIAALILKEIRSVDSFGRWGGEEFMLICENSDLEGAYNLAEKIRVMIDSYDFETVEHISISLGVAQIEDGMTLNDLLSYADEALYSAKESGRNRTKKYEV